jgi:hypothetical protein
MVTQKKEPGPDDARPAVPLAKLTSTLAFSGAVRLPTCISRGLPEAGRPDRTQACSLRSAWALPRRAWYKLSGARTRDYRVGHADALSGLPSKSLPSPMYARACSSFALHSLDYRVPLPEAMHLRRLAACASLKPLLRSIKVLSRRRAHSWRVFRNVHLLTLGLHFLLGNCRLSKPPCSLSPVGCPILQGLGVDPDALVSTHG